VLFFICFGWSTPGCFFSLNVQKKFFTVPVPFVSDPMFFFFFSSSFFFCSPGGFSRLILLDLVIACDPNRTPQPPALTPVLLRCVRPEPFFFLCSSPFCECFRLVQNGFTNPFPPLLSFLKRRTAVPWNPCLHTSVVLPFAFFFP